MVRITTVFVCCLVATTHAQLRPKRVGTNAMGGQEAAGGSGGDGNDAMAEMMGPLDDALPLPTASSGPAFYNNRIFPAPPLVGVSSSGSLTDLAAAHAVPARGGSSDDGASSPRGSVSDGGDTRPASPTDPTE